MEILIFLVIFENSIIVFINNVFLKFIFNLFEFHKIIQFIEMGKRFLQIYCSRIHTQHFRNK